MIKAPETYLQYLYQGVGKIDQRNMSKEFREVFDTEVEAEGFIRHAKSFVVTGHTATSDCNAAFACLYRGSYAVAMMDVRLITRRLDSKWIPRWTAEDDDTVSKCECLILHGLFDGSTESMTPAEKADLAWFIKDCLTNGVMILTPCRDTEADLDILGEAFGEFIENTFEVVHGPQTDKTQKPSKQRNRNKQHGGDEAASKRGGKRIRKNTKGHTT